MATPSWARGGHRAPGHRGGRGPHNPFSAWGQLLCMGAKPPRPPQPNPSSDWGQEPPQPNPCEACEAFVGQGLCGCGGNAPMQSNCHILMVTPGQRRGSNHNNEIQGLGAIVVTGFKGVYHEISLLDVRRPSTHWNASCCKLV